MDKTKFPQNPEVDAFKQNILKTAEEMVVDKFPKRIIQLNKLLTSGKLTSHPSSVYQKINIPVPEPSNLNVKAQQQELNEQDQTSKNNDNKTLNGETGVSNDDNHYSIERYLTYYMLAHR